MRIIKTIEIREFHNKLGQFDEMVKQLHDIDLSKVIEMVDNTARQDELACAAGNCEVA